MKRKLIVSIKPKFDYSHNLVKLCSWPDQSPTVMIRDTKLTRLRLAAIAVWIFYALYSMQCILSIVFYLNTLCSMHCILYIAFYALYFMHCITYIIFYALHYIHCVLCIVFLALYSLHCIPCIVFYALYSMRCIP